MNLDNSYIGPYLQDWLKYTRECNNVEQQSVTDGKEFRIPYSGVQTEMVRVIFILSDRFNLEPQAKYLAIHLLDKYMSCFFWELVSNAELSNSLMQQIREKMSNQIKLILASCLQIASKVDLSKSGLDITQMQTLLRWIDPQHEYLYNKASISTCELRILKSLDFRLPVCLPIHAVELFIAYAELTAMPLVRDTCIHLLDVAYLRHEDVFEQLHIMARGSKYDKSSPCSRDFLALEVNTGFIGAAVVICSNFFFHLKRRLVENLTAKLAGLIDMNPIDVNIMANILFTFAIDEEDFKAMMQKSGDEVD